MSEEHIAKNIKAVRQRKRLTQQRVADLAGLTKGYLSRIERSKKAPPYSTVNRLAAALEVDVAFLLQENSSVGQDARIAFTKRGKGQQVETMGAFYGYGYEVLASGKPGKNMVPYIIEPAFDETGVFQHEGEEFLFILEGRHEFIYDGKSYIMEQGDSVYFDSGTPHTGRSLGKKRAKMLAIMFSYKRL